MAPALLFQVTPFPHGPGRAGQGAAAPALLGTAACGTSGCPPAPPLPGRGGASDWRAAVIPRPHWPAAAAPFGYPLAAPAPSELCTIASGGKGREAGTATAPKPSPPSPADVGKGLKQVQVARAQGRVSPLTFTVHSSPSPCARPPPARQVARAFPPVAAPWAGGDGTSGCGAGVPPFSVPGAGGPWAVPGAAPAAVPALPSGVAPQPARARLPARAALPRGHDVGPPAGSEGEGAGAVLGRGHRDCPGAACLT